MKSKRQLIFTFITEFRGGTYCTQVQSMNINEAIEFWTKQLEIERNEIKHLGDKVIAELKIKTKEIENQPVRLTRLKNVWYAYYSTKQGIFSVNIILTQSS